MTNEIISTLLEYERYIPVMGYAEIVQLKAGRLDWSKEDFVRWELLLMARDWERNKRISEAMMRSKRGGKCKSGASVKKYITK